ncbi:hypothetical protein [Methanimicrococcus blatticola]|uniref:Uncharacterized protein n=1 Tax=Methanimicrococcus blatticola TaxID=91560 RepID=A0A484F5Z4_9EURY|nr:hypothetical protein [Methanimicrococcus blatticola]MBZ3936079.1 hypothetical protein [Methanimicrococcus blatticola]MCC2509312.1 hypothetical protein [Methanimicrococcus blatticola]TDQ68197.1 hypothetical protein C7391_1134 [Methanimicrococcus blatticola]
MSGCQNPKINDVVKHFDNLKLDKIEGQLVTYPAQNYAGNVVESHIQGLALYDGGNNNQIALISHNNKGEPKGYYIASQKIPYEKHIKFDSYDENYNHPSGMQIIGDYLVVGVESGSKGKVRRYDLTPLKTELGIPNCLETTVDSTFNHKLSAVGVTNYFDGENEWYLFALCFDQTVYFYRYPADQGFQNIKFDWSDENKFFFCKLEKDLSQKLKGDFQGVNLITQPALDGKHDKIFLVAFVSESLAGPKYKDWCYLFEVDCGLKRAICVRETVTKCKYGSEKGLTGVHFRYGTGVSITSESDIPSFKLLASARLCVGRHLDINIFEEK